MSNLHISIGTSAFTGTSALKTALAAVKAAGIKEIDTAHMYGNNEADLGNAGVAGLDLIISSKNVGGWGPGRGKALLPENLKKTAQESLDKLKIRQLDIFYVHGPDRTLKLEEWVPGFDELHKKGVFRRFGVSNFSADEVRELYNFSKKNKYVLPTVYQGNYNAVARKIETTLFPTLRELGIAFYAYSPLAGGFLTKTRKALEDGTAGGRFGTEGQGIQEMYRSMYLKPTLLDGLDKWEATAAEEGTSKSNLASRWTYYHSALKPEQSDVLILGASKVNHIQSSVDGLKEGQLKESTVKSIDEIWELIKDDAPLDNYDGTQS